MYFKIFLLFKLVMNLFYFSGWIKLATVKIGHQYINIYFHLYYSTAQISNFWILVMSKKSTLEKEPFLAIKVQSALIQTWWFLCFALVLRHFHAFAVRQISLGTISMRNRPRLLNLSKVADIYGYIHGYYRLYFAF